MANLQHDEHKEPPQLPADIYSHNEQLITSKPQQAKASDIFITVGAAIFSFFLAYINYWTLGEQDSAIGFAARNREPSETGILLGGLGIVVSVLIGIFLLGVAFLSGGRKPKLGNWTIYPAVSLVVPGAITLYAYLSTW